jgi:hypothetical protein
MATITRDELVERLMAVRGAKQICIVTETDARLNKTVVDESTGKRVPNPLAGAVKLARSQVTLNPLHERNVNAQRGREDKPMDYKAGPCQWGNREFREDGTVVPIRMLDGKPHAMVVKFERSLEKEYRLDGKAVDTAAVEAQLKERKEKAAAAAKEKQGVEDTVVHLTYRLDSIRQVVMDGVVWEIE